MAPHSSALAWKIPWTEEPGRLWSVGLLRIGHDWVTSLFSLSCIGEGNGNPLQCSCLENPRDGGAWWAAVYGVAQSRTRPKWLSSREIIELHVWYITEGCYHIAEPWWGLVVINIKHLIYNRNSVNVASTFLQNCPWLVKLLSTHNSKCLFV